MSSPITETVDAPTIEPPRQNGFGRMEWAGAFGDLETLIPFVIASIVVPKIGPFGILFGFGMIDCGGYCKPPFPANR